MEKIVIDNWGSGLGDAICQEPSIRYAARELYPNCPLTLTTPFPDVYKHLDIQLLPERRDYSDFDRVVLASPYRPNVQGGIEGHPILDYAQLLFVNMVDFFSMFMIRRQLPDNYRKPVLPHFEVSLPIPEHFIVVHIAATDSHRTFPVDLVGQMVHELCSIELPVVVFGQTKSAVPLPPDAINLVNQLTIPQTVELVRRAQVLVTNDSAPLHIAAATDTPVVLIPTIRHPDRLLHNCQKIPGAPVRVVFKKLMLDDRDFPLDRLLGFDWFPQIENVYDYYPDVAQVKQAVLELLQEPTPARAAMAPLA